MDDRERLRSHIEEFLDRPECTDEIRNEREDISRHVMEALDSWIEENTSEIKVGDRVKLVRKLEEEDGSPTDNECGVTEEMAEIPAGDEGTVKNFHRGGEDFHVFVKFDSVESAWNFDAADLEKVHT